jgi:acyl-CoA ligase (AMP-forming) (exosortase A-associated)
MSEAGGARRAALLPVRVDQLLGCGAPDRPALTCKSETLTYRELTNRVARFAAGLHRLGIRRGDRVAVYAEKRIETVVALLATSAAGAVFVPVNPLFKVRHLARLLTNCAARALITTTERSEVVRESLGADTAVEHVVIIGGDPGNSPLSDGPWQVSGWDRLADAEPVPVPDGQAVIDDDIAAILYTSGSTGGPKGVVLTHRNLLAGAASVAGYLGHTSDDVVLAVLPISFDAGLSQLTTSFIAGAHVVLMNYLLPREVVRLCAEHQVTALTCVPPLWLQLAGLTWPEEAVAKLRYFASTGGRMPIVTLGILRKLYPYAEPYLMYGLTEAFRSTYLEPAEADRRPGSIGKAIPNAEVLVVRPDGSACDPGEHGELVHRGALVARGYWNDPELTAARFKPAPGASSVARPQTAVWSGDTAYCDEDGYLYFVGRSDDMIKTSGYRVSPTEIEEAAYATGLVGEAVALGIDDERLGQHIVLIVTAAAGDVTHEGLVKALAQDLPKYMLPQRTQILPALPRSMNGKFDRAELRRMELQ